VGLLPPGRIIDLPDSNGSQEMLQMLPRPTSPKSQIDQAGLFRFVAGQTGHGLDVVVQNVRWHSTQDIQRRVSETDGLKGRVGGFNGSHETVLFG
jgi:hypothetical protein